MMEEEHEKMQVCQSRVFILTEFGRERRKIRLNQKLVIKSPENKSRVLMSRKRNRKNEERKKNSRIQEFRKRNEKKAVVIKTRVFWYVDIASRRCRLGRVGLQTFGRKDQTERRGRRYKTWKM